MTNEVSIFKNGGQVATAGTRRKSAMSQTLGANGMNRRIQTNTNGTFRRMVNGEQIGNAIRGEINLIILRALPNVSRVFYAGKYDPNATPTAPDCWANDGDVPDKAAKNIQASSCALCPQNVKGSGDNGGRACRYQRRTAVLVEGDKQKDIYQFQIPAKSLFGKGVNNTHPFESYVKFLAANNESVDTVVTNVSYNLNSDTMELLFTPVRTLEDAEYAEVEALQRHPDALRYPMITAFQADTGAAQTATQVAAQAKIAAEDPAHGEGAQGGASETVAAAPEVEEGDEEGEPVAAAPSVKKARQPTQVETPAGAQALGDALDDWITN